MKQTRISINGQDLSQVRTRAVPNYPTRSFVYFGSPDVFVTEESDGLAVEMYPLTLAQLYFDGVLPQDRAIPVQVKVGRKKARPFHIDSMITRKNPWRSDIVVLRLVPVRSA